MCLAPKLHDKTARTSLPHLGAELFFPRFLTAEPYTDHRIRDLLIVFREKVGREWEQGKVRWSDWAVERGGVRCERPEDPESVEGEELRECARVDASLFGKGVCARTELALEEKVKRVTKEGESEDGGTWVRVGDVIQLAEAMVEVLGRDGSFVAGNEGTD